MAQLVSNKIIQQYRLYKLLRIVCCKRSLVLVNWFNIKFLCLESHTLSYMLKVVLKLAVICLENNWHEKSFFGPTLPGHKY